MASWHEVIAHVAHNVEKHYDRLKTRLQNRIGRNNGLMILPYRGYGSINRLYLKGRVLEDKGITTPEDDDSVWDNLLNMYKRFESDEIPHAKVQVRFQEVEQIVTADEEGFFEVRIESPSPLTEDKMWWEVDLELLEPQSKVPVTTTGTVLVPGPQAQYGVISDIDDTVLQTGAENLLLMARTVFLGNARTRLPFKGVAALYRAFFEGISGDSRNPLFYVSSSPWNLYDLLSDFFHLQDIPIGPVLFLRDWGLTATEILPLDNRDYKTKVCRQILDDFPSLRFILVGDSSQQDPEIYSELVKYYPERILAVYIRNVSKDLERPEGIRKLAEEVLEAGSTLILADDTLPMARHAIQQGWIKAAAFPEIKAEKKADEAPPGTLEKALKGDEEAPTMVLKGEKTEDGDQTVEIQPPTNDLIDSDE